jgi:hypothetical protein
MIKFYKKIKLRFKIWRTMRKLRKDDPFIYEE